MSAPQTMELPFVFQSTHPQRGATGGICTHAVVTSTDRFVDQSRPVRALAQPPRPAAAPLQPPLARVREFILNRRRMGASVREASDALGIPFEEVRAHVASLLEADAPVIRVAPWTRPGREGRRIRVLVDCVLSFEEDRDGDGEINPDWWLR